jgi:DNA ligase-1
MHGLTYGGQNVAGWLLQEKLDGLRALWTGSALITRNGNHFNAPDWFTAGLPSTLLDGELYAGRGTLRRLAGRLVSARSSAGEDWRGVTFNVFDAPNSRGGYVERMAAVNVGGCARVIPFEPLGPSLEAWRPSLARLQSNGGEGFMLREPSAPYCAGRTASLLKFK